MTDKKPWTDRLIEAGEKMQEVGDGMSKPGGKVKDVGNAITSVVYGLFALAILFGCLWTFVFSK